MENKYPKYRFKHNKIFPFLQKLETWLTVACENQPWIPNNCVQKAYHTIEVKSSWSKTKTGNREKSIVATNLEFQANVWIKDLGQRRSQIQLNWNF